MAKAKSPAAALWASHKYIIIAVLVLLILVVGYIIYLRTRKKVEVRLETQQLVDDANSEIDTNKVTITNVQFNTLASKLYTAMKGWGTDEDAIYEVFDALESRSDLLQLQKVFGMKDDKTMEEYLFSELNRKEIDKINRILASKNINYMF